MKNLILKLFGCKKTAKQQEPAQPTIQITEQPFTVNNGGILGAIIGDIAGSRFEFRNEKSTDIKLFTEADDFTDDTVMTIAVADWLLIGASLPNIMRDGEMDTLIGVMAVCSMSGYFRWMRVKWDLITRSAMEQVCVSALADMRLELLMKLSTLPSSQQKLRTTIPRA